MDGAAKGDAAIGCGLAMPTGGSTAGALINCGSVGLGAGDICGGAMPG